MILKNINKIEIFLNNDKYNNHCLIWVKLFAPVVAKNAFTK